MKVGSLVSDTNFAIPARSGWYRVTKVEPGPDGTVYTLSLVEEEPDPPWWERGC